MTGRFYHDTKQGVKQVVFRDLSFMRPDMSDRLRNMSKEAKIWAAVSAVILIAAFIFLFVMQGICVTDFNTYPVPSEYTNVCLKKKDVLCQRFLADDTTIRGVSVYPIMDELAASEGTLTVELMDVTSGDDQLIAAAQAPLSGMSTAEWSFIPFRGKLSKGHTYEIRYSHDAPKKAEVWFVLFSKSEQQAFDPLLDCESASLGGEYLEGCIFQVLHVLHPAGIIFNTALFLSLSVLLFGILCILTHDKHAPEGQLSGIDMTILKMTERWLMPVCLTAAFIIAALVRLSLISMESGDYTGYLLPWLECYKTYGIRDSLAILPGNYYVPYNLLLALTSKLPFEPYWSIAAYAFAGDIMIALFGAGIVKMISEERGAADGRSSAAAGIAAAILLMLPPVFLDSAAWKQADTIYIGFLTGTVYFIGKKKYPQAFILFSLAFVFKLQAVFLLPVLIILYFCRRFSLKYFLTIPVTYLIAGLPSVLCGGSPAAVYSRYIGQTEDTTVMSSMFPNVYNLGLFSYEWLKLPAVLFTLFCFVMLFLYCVKRREKLEGTEAVLRLSVLSVWTCVMFLPAMHQRYGLGVAVLLTVLFLSDHRNRLLAALTVTTVLVETMVFAGYLFADNGGVPLLVQTFLYIACFFTYAGYLFHLSK